ncbi:INO80 complex subunit Ies4-domain-containing protein [Lipomyces arxii]|uniref:INO80 complex subunit Ies4-domain-containing protein n=1 Tax=Lipomyces arxii TaxID=56418 RepID=UPI0034CDFC88
MVAANGGKSRAVILKISPQLLMQQEQAMAASSITSASSPAPMPSSPLLAPASPRPEISTGPKQRSKNASGNAPKRKRKAEPQSSPGLTPLDPPTRPASALGGSPAADSLFPSALPTGATTPINSQLQQQNHHASHTKLGPKANQGSINAQLRALDRSGKPCRRWTSIPLELKSFTGWEWSVKTWYGGPRDASTDTKISKSTEKVPVAPSNNLSDVATPLAPVPLTITLPALSSLPKTKEITKIEDSSKKNNRRFPAALLRQSVDEFEVEEDEA